jgi:hypothetical protein
MKMSRMFICACLSEPSSFRQGLKKSVDEIEWMWHV